MNFLRVIVIGFWLITGSPVLATTLQLPEQIELLIVDGKALGSSLLRGAGGLELEKGQHQLVFTLTQVIIDPKGAQRSYTSPYIIAAFTTGSASSLKFRLPHLTSRAESERFSRQPKLDLLDQDGKPVSASFVRLEKGKGDLLEALNNYNRRLGLPVYPPSAGKPLPSDPAGPDAAATSPVTNTEQMLRFWFLQADPDTRYRFLLWAKHPHPDAEPR